jgi:L-galactonate dehydratase
MAEITITGWEWKDVRFPTSLDKTGSDAMNAAGDYSAAYCILQTDSKFSGHGMVSPHSSSHFDCRLIIPLLFLNR